MNKSNKLISLIFILITGCYDPFDLTRNDIISDEMVFDNPTLADAFLFDLYDRAQFHIKSGNGNLNMGLISSFGGESRNYGVSWQTPYTQVLDVDYNENGLIGKVLDYYDYSLIRECNQMITKLPQSENLSQSFINTRVSEARFIRSHAYFEMAKRFGGVPLVTDVIPVQGSYDEVYKERNSEKEIYDFISNEMDEISNLLPSQSGDEGRITKWVALSLKSRAMLYAASIANFGNEQLDGLLGFPSEEAQLYYKKSLDASREIIQSGVFALYNEEEKYGVTCHHMSQTVDTGPIISTKSFPIFESDSVASLLTRTYDFQLTLFYEIMNKILNDEENHCIYIDTDSVFYSATPLVKKRFPNMDINDEDKMSKAILEIADEVQDYLNKSYDYFANKFLSIDDHVFDIKQEVIAKTGLFITKKRYGLKIINDAGRKVNKIHVKGLDTIRSNFALAMKKLLSKVLEDILANVPKDKIDERIMKFKRNMTMLHYDVMANPIGVKGIGKYEVKDTDSPFSTFRKGAPVHVKAAINYNSLLEYWYEGRKYEKITNSTKIKWVYLKDNEFGFDTIGYKGYEDPPQILNLIKEKIDHSRMFEQAMSKKIGMFYEAMKWGDVVDKQASIERFF